MPRPFAVRLSRASSAIVARPSGSETERGLRWALGARGRHVATQFLLEAAALAVIRGILGVALGCLATAVVAHVGGNPVTIPLSARLAGLGAAIAVGVLAGAYPAARAARLSPADALRAP
jgi:putative ABC transport system permease protein